MTGDQIQKLRRSALLVALYLLATPFLGLEIAKLGKGGVGMTIGNPGRLVYVICAVSLFQIGRFWLYAIWHHQWPCRHRDDVIKRLGNPKFNQYTGTILQARSRSDLPPDIDAALALYPRFLGAEVREATQDDIYAYNERVVRRNKKKYGDFPPDADDQLAMAGVEGSPLYFRVPLRCRIGALLEDLDYTAPLWLSLLSVATALFFKWFR